MLLSPPLTPSQVIDESPSTFVDAEFRSKLGRQAVDLARLIGYDSAGEREIVDGAECQVAALAG